VILRQLEHPVATGGCCPAGLPNFRGAPARTAVILPLYHSRSSQAWSANHIEAYQRRRIGEYIPTFLPDYAAPSPLKVEAAPEHTEPCLHNRAVNKRERESQQHSV
jgi:hypothetical protein